MTFHSRTRLRGTQSVPNAAESVIRPRIMTLGTITFASLGTACLFAFSGCSVPAVDLNLSNQSFDFGPTVLARKIIRNVVTLTNGGTETATLTMQHNGEYQCPSSR